MCNEFELGNLTECLKDFCYHRLLVTNPVHWHYPGNYAYISRIAINDENDRFFECFGYVQYSDGKRVYGKIPNGGCYEWYVLKAYDDTFVDVMKKKGS